MVRCSLNGDRHFRGLTTLIYFRPHGLLVLPVGALFPLPATMGALQPQNGSAKVVK